MKYLFLSLFLVFSFVSCEDEDDEEVDQLSAQALEDNAEFETTFNDIENVIADVAGKENDTASYRNRSCASITVTPSWASGIFPKTIEVDFGDTNCLGPDGNYRRGKVIVELSGRYRDSSSVISTRFDNYFHNDARVQGTKTKTNLGRNSQNQLLYQVKVENARIDHPNGYTITWESTRLISWINGENTIFNFLDDEYLIGGNAEGRNGDGMRYTLDINNDLLIQLNCRWIKSGLITLTPQDLEPRTVDYGPGACDRVAHYTVNGQTYQFTMR